MLSDIKLKYDVLWSILAAIGEPRKVLVKSDGSVKVYGLQESDIRKLKEKFSFVEGTEFVTVRQYSEPL